MNSKIDWIVIIAISIYLMGTTVIGILMKKRSKSVQQFFVAKKNLGVLLIIPLLFGEHAAGGSTVGNAAGGYNFGISSTWYVLGISFSCFLLSSPVLKFFRAMGNQNKITIPAIIEARFDRKTRIVLMAITLLVTCILFGLQPIAAAGILAPIFNVNVATMAWIVSIIFIIVTVNGGLKGIAWMNLVHSSIMYLSISIVTFFSIKNLGGISTIAATLPITYFSFLQPDFITILGWFAGSALSMLVSAPNVGIALGARTMEGARKGFIIGGIILIPYAILTSMIGISAKIALPNINPNSCLYAMGDYLGPAYSSLISVGIVAAVFSTAPAILLAISTTITKDFYYLINKDASEDQQMFVAKASIIILGIITTFLGLQAKSILHQVLGAMQIRAVAGFIVIMSILWKRFDSNAAFWSMLFGGATAAFWHFAGSPFNIVPLWPSLAVCIVIMIPLTLLSKKPVADGYIYVQKCIEELLENERLLETEKTKS